MRPVGQDTLTGSWDLQGSLGGSWDLRKQRQTTENETKIIKIMKIVENALIWIGLG